LSRRNAVPVPCSRLGAVESAHPAFDELRRHARLMETLSEGSRAAHEEDDLERPVARVVASLAARLDVPIASILLLDETAETFVVEVYAGDLHLNPPGGGEIWPV